MSVFSDALLALRYPHPDNQPRAHPGCTPADLSSLLLDDIRAALAYFDKHPIQASMDSSEATGFHH